MRILIVFLDERSLEGWQAMDSQMNPHSTIMLHSTQKSYRMDDEFSCIDCRVIRDTLDIDSLRGRRYDFIIFHDAWLRNLRPTGRVNELRSLIYATVLR